jgi:uncharacterized protein YggE
MVGRLPMLTVARVTYGLSREVREQAELEASTRAIALYRAKAADYARQFGASSYELRDVSVSTTSERPPPRPMMEMAGVASARGVALPVESGLGDVSVLVHGSIQLR